MVAGGKAQPVTDTPVGGAGVDAVPYRGKGAQGRATVWAWRASVMVICAGATNWKF
jgi:hypothetical protein